MVNALQAMQYIQGQGDLGRERGMQNQLAKLSSQAYTAAPEQQQGLLANTAAISPQAAAQMQGQFNASEDRTLSQLRGYVQFVNQARQTGNPQAVSAALRAGGPLIQRVTGKAPPTEWTPEMDAGWAELEAKVAMGGAGAGSRVQSRFVGEDGQVYAMMADSPVPVPTGIKADRQMWFRDHPGMAPQLVGKDGQIVPIGGPQQFQQGAPGSAQAPVPQGGGQGFVEDSMALANQMIAAGIPAEQVDAFVQARMNPAPSAMPAQGPQTQQSQGGALAPRLDYMGGGLARPSEAQTAAEVEAAKQAAQLSYLPQELGLRTQAALAQKSGESEVAIQAEQAGQAATRARDADSALELLNEAERLLPDATGGMVGTAVDATLGAFGRATEGSNATAQLQTIAGQLTSRMPRMQGPQSDKDVQLYKEMAGDLANSMLPVARRQAALQQIRRLNQKYASGNQAAAPARVQSSDDYNALPPGALYIAPDGSQRRKR